MYIHNPTNAPIVVNISEVKDISLTPHSIGKNPPTVIPTLIANQGESKLNIYIQCSTYKYDTFPKKTILWIRIFCTFELVYTTTIPMLRRILTIISLILGFLLLAFLLIRFFLPSSADVSGLPGYLPKIINTIIPGEKNTNTPNILTQGLTIPDLVIDDQNLTSAQQSITTIESTITEMKGKLEETEKKIKQYNDYKTLLGQGSTRTTGTTNNPSTVDTNTGGDSSDILGTDFEATLERLRGDVVKYTELITGYEIMLDRFQKSIVYYYCNGYAQYQPGDTVDISRLHNNIIIITHANGSREQISCGWKGITTEFTPDSPYYPKNLFENLPDVFKNVPNPFRNIQTNYIKLTNWADIDHSSDPVDWQSAPPVWSYYFNIFLNLFVSFSLDFSVSISQYYSDYFALYPIDDITRHQSVTIWFDRYNSYRYRNDFTVTGRINTGTNTDPICANLRIGIPKTFDTNRSTDTVYLNTVFDLLDPVSIQTKPLEFTVLDRDGEPTSQTEECTVTGPGIWKSFRVILRDVDINKPYLFDIIDRDFTSYRINRGTGRVSLLPYRYWGPQTVRNLDTLTPQVFLSYTPVTTVEQQTSIGILTPDKTKQYQTQYDPVTQKLSLLFQVLVHDDRLSNIITNSNVLNINPASNGGLCTRELPDLKLHLDRVDGTSTVFSNPLETVRVPTSTIPGTDTPSPNTFLCSFIYTNIDAKPDDLFYFVNEFTETLLYGEEKVEGVGQSTNQDAYGWWYYYKTFNPLVEGEYYKSEAECKTAGLKIEKRQVTCYETALVPAITLSYVEPTERDPKGVAIGSKITETSAHLVFRAKTQNKNVVFRMKYGVKSLETDFAKRFAAMNSVDPNVTLMTQHNKTKDIFWDISGLEKDKEYEYVVYGIPADGREYLGAKDSFVEVVNIGDQTKPRTALFYTDTLSTTLPSKGIGEGLSFSGLFDTSGMTAGAGVKTNITGSTGPLVPCGWDINGNGHIDAPDRKRYVLNPDGSIKKDAKGREILEYYATPTKWDPNRGKLADGTIDPNFKPDPNGELCTFNHLIQMTSNILNLFFTTILVILIVFRFGYVGYLFITSGSNPGKRNEAKGILKSVLKGTLIALLAWIIVASLFSLLGIETWLDF